MRDKKVRKTNASKYIAKIGRGPSLQFLSTMYRLGGSGISTQWDQTEGNHFDSILPWCSEGLRGPLVRTNWG